MPLNNNINSLNLSYNDRLDRDPLTTFPSKFNTTTNVNTDLDCISIFGPVNNLDCPNEYPDCNCPQAFIELRPTFPEPTISELEVARNQAEECFLIQEEFSTKNGFDIDEYRLWGGIDYSNKDSTYNCLGTEDYGKFTFKGANGGSKLGPFQELKGISGTEAGYGPSSGGLFPYSVRVSYSGNAWDVPPTGNVIGSLSTFYQGAANETIYPILAGKNFPYYLEYSKTYATFWNTPEKTPLYRKAQTSLLKYQRIKILVNGDFIRDANNQRIIKPGKLIYVNIPINNRTVTNITSRYEGVWMIYRAERIIRPGKHSVYLYLMRDYPSVSPDLEPNDIFVDKTNT
jgi:hypothetical protein